jgi:hypothetical protein
MIRNGNLPPALPCRSKEQKMKRILMMVLFSLTLSFLWAQAAIIREISGTVELKPNDQADWIPAKTGDAIAVSAIISTGFKSAAVIAVGNSTLLVRPLTRLSLSELLSRNETETVELNLRTGRVRVEVTPPAGGKTDFTVRAPTATASVRGTVFDIDTLNLRVIEGTVRYEGAARACPVLVNTGQSTWVDSGTGKASNPVTAAETSRALPALPGGASVPALGGVQPENNSPGSLSVTVTLASQ